MQAQKNVTSRRAALVMVAIAGMTMLWTPPAEATNDVKITKSAFRFGAKRYFRGNAENVRLGSFGTKKTPVTQANYLAVHNNIAAGNLKKVVVRSAGPYPIEWQKTSSTDFSAGLKFLKSNGASASFSRDVAMSANLVLVKLYLNEGPLMNLLNKHAGGARSFLADNGGSARVVSEVWIVVEASLGSKITNSFSLTGNASPGGGLELEVGAGTSNTTSQKISIPPDTTFAYLLHKVKSWSNKKTVVADVEDDQHGPV